ncbi:Zinc transporter ZupT [[Clostridium] cellulosi]|uniref:Zinc transporter ZupT n=1 Tax=[Clostridium] cellulosi TaxID=29343 RepID=A0A078KMX2_9FIRM|nr:MAG: zinc transporter ZupT [[Clostridium] cellulosi]CDZ23818.1 Zinc transporter ZupT [[Clostridium] cellulosi]
MTSGVLPALLLSTIAGLSTAIGSLIALFSKKNDTRFMSAALGFSAGVMITVSFAELLPEAQKNISVSNPRYGPAISLCFLATGVALAAIIDMLIPSDIGISGGIDRSGASLLHMGVVTAIAITVHNFPEGIATFMAGYSDIKIGLPVALSIAMHNIPEGVAVSVPIYFGTGKRGKAFLYSAASGLSEPLGALIAYLCLAPFLNTSSLGGVFAVVAGIMVYIAFGELVPASERYKRPRAAVVGIVMGTLFMLFILTASGT